MLLLQADAILRIAEEVNGISWKMLNRELKDLEINELIDRHVLTRAPVAVEYRITDYG
ncbi:winged helix-turn-helix transcriptional regulator [Chryseobacterium fluminis]|uniref:winged helix-turn-helix transcriptional regulator n=1 Tax=Chryseobacterium fluminis TaxID=2983606 RepID=UPI0022572730|nr:winged helix-turn-helix transcriptional regulator [Chryseobacterium sp. MMS21-Ot14]UZT99038.1 winged helix-turn-helix transcriptional regulator [Chryseobacterium sp. MMS21-Ot14]